MNHSLQTILIDLTPVLPGGENGGAKWLVFELITHLAQHAPTTHFVLLTHPAAHDEIKTLKQSNISLLTMPAHVLHKSFAARALGYIMRKLPFIPSRVKRLAQRLEHVLSSKRARGFIQQIKPDLLFCPFTAPTYSISGIPTVCVVHDLQYKTYPMFFDATDRKHREHIFLEACRRATLLITVSNYTRQSVLQHSTLEPSRVVAALSRVADRIKNSATDETILDRLGLTSKHYFIYPANYWLHKNHEALLNAFCLATQQAEFPTSMKLVCVGALKSRQAWLQKAVKRMGLSERILLTEHLSQPELTALMQHSYALVFPSLYEGFGMPVLEAMAMGVPVACSQMRSLPEVAGDAALYFDPRIPTDIANALVKLCTDQETYQHLIQSGQKRSEIFSDTGQMAAEYWQAFIQSYQIAHA